MITKLTREQEARIPQIIDEWNAVVVNGDTSINEQELHKGIEWLYGLNKKPMPFVFVVDSPLAAQLAANVMIEVLGKLLKKSKSQLRSQLESQLGSQLGSQQIKWHDFSWRDLTDGCWVAFYEFAHEIGVEYKANNWEDLQTFKRLIKSGIMMSICLDGLAIVVRRPKQVHRDERKMLHNSSGPAVEWLDGYKDYFYHGVSLPSWVIEEPSKITHKTILEERNVEVRRCMIERIGYAAFLKQADPKTLDKDKDVSGMSRRLLSIEVPNDEPVVVVEVNCPSTRHKHLLRVPPTVKTCSEAVAWSFDFEAKKYAPLTEA